MYSKYTTDNKGRFDRCAFNLVKKIFSITDVELDPK